MSTVVSDDGKTTTTTCNNKINKYELEINDVIDQGNEENEAIENGEVYSSVFDFDISFDNIKTTKTTFQFCSTNAKINNEEKIIINKYVISDYVGFQFFSADTGKAIKLFQIKVDNPDDVEYSVSEDGEGENFQATITITFKNPTSTLRYSLRNNKYFVSTKYYDHISVEYENCNYKKS